MFERFQRHLLTSDRTEKSAFVSMMLKPVNVILGLVYTPLLLSYLGDESYGLWATILSVISWVNYFDVGIGNGLRNVLADLLSDEEQNKNNIKKVVSTSYILLTAISCGILLILLILVGCMNWSKVFSTSLDMRLPLIISFVFICVNFVLSLSNSIMYAMQRSELVSLRNVYVQVVNIIGIVLLNRFTEGSLIYVSILFGTSTCLVYIYNSIRIFKLNSNIIPAFRAFSKNWILPVCGVGIKFFIIQLMGLAMFTVDNILITHYFGADKVTPFSIVDKIFNTAYAVWAAFLIPYWTGTTTAIAEDNIKWIKDSIYKVTKLFFLFFAGYILLAFVFKPLAALWLHQELDYQPGLIWLMCVFYIFYSVLAIECQFINGTGRINTQLVLYIILGIVNVPLSICLGVYVGLGPLGVRLATTILVFIEIVVLGFNLRKIVKDLEVSCISR